ncbi:uncharacterized protein [Antedon mediterranea]|uniref:uncharacterized protein n=1 Tax=Antedon mediterranea TaxID=105859 RepID=UPI003AF4ABD3
MNHLRLLNQSLLCRRMLLAPCKAAFVASARPRPWPRPARFDRHCYYYCTWDQCHQNNGASPIGPDMACASAMFQDRNKKLSAPRIGVYRQTNGKLHVGPVFNCQDLHFLIKGQHDLKNRSRSRRSESLNKDVRPTSVMCLTDGMHIYPAEMWKAEEGDAKRIGNKKQQELPAVFMIEESQINALLSLISSSILELQLKEKILKLVNEVLHVDRLMCTTAKPHNCNADDIACYADMNYNSSNKLEKCRHITQDQGTINDIIKNEWRENDIKCYSYFKSLVDVKSNDVHSTSHVYFRRGVPQLSSQYGKDVVKALRPSKEQLNLMMEKLSEEMPNFFAKNHDFNIYSSNILFENKVFHIKTRGLVAYKGSIQTMKYSSFVYFTDLQMEVLKISLQEERDNIQVRWRVKGLPAHTYYINKLLRRKTRYRYFDAFSTFYIGQDGLIHRHVLDKVIPSPEEKAQALSWLQRLALSLGLVRPPSLAGDWNSNTR